MAANLQPLEQVALERLKDWLPKLSHPVRIGEHGQTAFGLGLILDYARTANDEKLAALVESKARQFFVSDKMIGEDGPLAQYGIVPLPEKEAKETRETVKNLKTMGPLS